MIPVDFRLAKAEDVPFILDSWLRSYKTSNYALPIPADIYFPLHRAAVLHMVQHPGISCRLAVNPRDAEQIYGYLIHLTSAPVIHYVYVKYPFRKFGIGTRLITDCLQGEAAYQGVSVHASHWSSFAKKFNLVYNPYLIQLPPEPANEVSK